MYNFLNWSALLLFIATFSLNVSFEKYEFTDFYLSLFLLYLSVRSRFIEASGSAGALSDQGAAGNSFLTT